MSERVLPRDFPIPPQFYIPLSNLELQELGTFIAIWSQLWIILMVFCYLAKVQSNMTTGQRVNLVRKLCQADKTNSIKAALIKLLNDNGALIDDRNHAIHGLWAIEYDLETSKTRAACEKTNRKPVPAEKLSILSNRAAEFCNKLADLLIQLNPQLKPLKTAPGPYFFAAGIIPDGSAWPKWPPE